MVGYDRSGEFVTVVNEKLQYMHQVDGFQIRWLNIPYHFWKEEDLKEFFDFEKKGRISVFLPELGDRTFAMCNRHQVSNWLVIPVMVVDDEVTPYFDHYMRLGDLLDES